MANRDRRRLNFEGAIKDGPGKGAGGFNVQTANGTGRWSGTGWNKDYDWSMEQLAPDATRPAGRSNRTAE